MIPRQSSAQKRRIKVAILSGFPLSALESGAMGRGGGQGCTWLPQLAQAYERYPEFEIHWIVLDCEARKPEVVQRYGQFFYRLPICKFSLQLALNYWPTRRAFKKQLKAIQPDIVHAWGTESINPAGLLDFNGPRILSMQGILTEYDRIQCLPSNWLWRKMVKFESRFIHAASVVTSESQWGIDKVKLVRSDVKNAIIEYGVHPSFFNVEWTPQEEVPYALYVGGSDRRKGFDILMNALKLIPDRTWEVRIAGSPDLQNSPEFDRVSNVKILGVLGWAEMQRQLAGAWCSVLPTRGDTSPNSVKEARVVGVPVITSSNGGQAGYIQDAVNGWLIDPLNEDELAKVLIRHFSSFDQVVKLGTGNHEKDRQHLSPERTAAGFIDLYGELGPKD
jgi:glycosyltransferase involved in cell wall biosynthesis